MPSNERINKRKEKQRKKDKRTKVIIWSILLAILIIMMIMKVCEIDYRSIKDTFSNNTSASSVSNIYPYSLDNHSQIDFNIINSKFALMTDSNVEILNIQNAKKLYSFEHGYASPKIEYAGNYLCLYDQGGTRLRLDTLSENLYEKHIEKPIIAACVANNGTVAYSTFNESSKSKLVVMTKSENKKSDIEIKDGFVTAIALNSNASKCAYVTVNSVNGKFTSFLHIMKVGEVEDIAVFEYQNSDILKLAYSSGNRLYVIGNDFLSIVKSDKNEETVFEKGAITALNYSFTKENELILNYNEYSNSQSTKIAYIKPNASIKMTINTDSEPKFISINSNKLTVLYSNKFVIYSLSSGEIKKEIACDSSVESVYSISSKAYIQYGQYLDVINTESEG